MPDYKTTHEFIKAAKYSHAMKDVERQIHLIANRKENDAEHTYGMLSILQWLRPLLLEEHSYDMLKVYDMILLHDLPEVLSGDVWYRDEQGRCAKAAREREAALKIMSEQQLSIWEEYEERKTPEAILAKKIDVLQALFSIVNSKGCTWKTNKVTREQEIEFAQWIIDDNDVISSIMTNLFEIATDQHMFYVK